MSTSYDVNVIGAGRVVMCAIRAAQLGLRTAVVAALKLRLIKLNE